jgi:hypothetical protein
VANFEELRKHRQQAERDAAFGEGNHTDQPEYHAARSALALFYIAEQLYLLRESFDGVIDGDRSITVREGR